MACTNKYLSIYLSIYLSYLVFESECIRDLQKRRTRHAGHCWRSKDELVSYVLLWTPAYGKSKAGRPARTYIQQLCDDTGCNPEDLPEAMNDRETWRERGSGISMLAARHDDDDKTTKSKIIWTTRFYLNKSHIESYVFTGGQNKCQT